MKKLVAATLGAVVACSGDPPESGISPTVTDSAGIRVVEHPTPQTWDERVVLSELVRVGAMDGPPELLFSRIAGGRLLESGDFVVADSESREVRQFSPRGVFIKAHGREGEGPGEYQFIIGIGNCAPEGFTVFDIGWTMSFYDGSGDFVEERLTRLEGGSTPYSFACEASGTLAAINWNLVDGPQVGFHVATGRLRLLGPDGSAQADLGERIGSERFGRPTGSGPHPIGRSTKFAFSNSDLIVADGSFFGFERWNPLGELQEIVRVAIPPPDGDSLMSVYLDWALSRASDDATRARFRREVAAMEGPPQASFLSDLIATDSHILVRELNVAQSGRWFRFGSDGTPLGFLPLPNDATLLDIRDGRLLVQERDELDVPAAVVYSISPG